MIFEKVIATLKDAINKHMDVSGRGEIRKEEEFGIPHKIRVLISRDLGQDELVVGLEDFKVLGILHHEFPRTRPEKRREDAKQVNVQYKNIRGDQWSEQMEVKEQRDKRERARGVLLYLEEMYEQVNENQQLLLFPRGNPGGPLSTLRSSTLRSSRA